jgi:uncharacterized membrane protein YdjX (TVP38/TMEM64 family)
LTSNAPARPHPPGERSAGLRGAVLRFALFALIVGAAVAAVAFTPLRAYVSKEHLLALLSSLRDAWWSPLALLALYVVLAPLGAPMTPLMICGGVLFGPVRGSLYNFLGLSVGATLSYYFARSFGRDLVVRLAGKRLRKAERVVAKRGFWALVGVRFLPLPFPLVNFGAALAGVRPGAFLGSSVLGLPGPCILYTVLWYRMVSAAEGEGSGAKRTFLIAMSVLVVLSVLPSAIAAWKRSRRYRALMAQRTGRG